MAFLQSYYQRVLFGVNMGDAVASPQHYVQGHIEAIYAIEQVLGKEGFRQFCMGNYLKYAMRHAHKNGEEDLKKAETYLDWAVNGLPPPVNNRVPHNRKISEAEARAATSLSAVLQHELEIKVPGEWRVTGVSRTPSVEKLFSQIVATVENKGGLSVQAVLPRVREGEQYSSIVFDIMSQFAELYPQGPWR